MREINKNTIKIIFWHCVRRKKKPQLHNNGQLHTQKCVVHPLINTVLITLL